MSVCSSSTAQQRGKDGCLWSEGRRQRRLHGEERALSSALLLSVVARLVGALGLLDVLLSVGGQSFVAPFSAAPQGQCCVSSLLGCRGWASWWAQTQVCGDAAVVVEGRRQSVDDLPPSRRPVPLFGWLVFSVSIFAGWPSWGASRPDGEKDSLKFRGESSVSKKLLV